MGEHDLAVDDGQERVAVCSKEEHPEYIRFLLQTGTKLILVSDYSLVQHLVMTSPSSPSPPR